MHQAAPMSRVQSARHLREDADRLPGVERAELHALAQVPPFDVAHCDEEKVVGRPRLVDRDDVRMID